MVTELAIPVKFGLLFGGSLLLWLVPLSLRLPRSIIGFSMLTSIAGFATAASVAVQWQKEEELTFNRHTMQREIQQHELATEAAAIMAQVTADYFPNPIALEVPASSVEPASSAESAVEVRQAEPEQSIPATATTSREADKALYLAVKGLLEAGKSQTWIIEEVLKLKGRKFSEGKERLQALLALGEQQRW